MICPVCFGRKYDFKKDGNSGYFVECKKCHGTGKIVQTNDEWRRTCSAEEFAKWMAQYCCDVNTRDVKEILKNEWLEWLKEKHTE